MAAAANLFLQNGDIGHAFYFRVSGDICLNLFGNACIIIIIIIIRNLYSAKMPLGGHRGASQPSRDR